MLVCIYGNLKKKKNVSFLKNKVDLDLGQHQNYLDFIPSFCCHKASLNEVCSITKKSQLMLELQIKLDKNAFSEDSFSAWLR